MTEINGTFSLHASLRVPLLSYKLNFVNFYVGIWVFFKYTEYVKKVPAAVNHCSLTCK